jgi:macrolide transport system ATP-binding/permease protein
MVRFFKKLGILFRRERFHGELEEEMTFHHEQQEKALQAEGLTGEEAKYAAKRQFGNAARLKDESMDAVGFRFENAVQDFRYALRQLRRNPGFACTAIFVLALGVGISVAIFSFVDAALLKPLPYPNPNRLVDVTESVAMIPRAALSYLDYLDWKKLNTVFSSMDVFEGSGFALRTPTGSELVAGTRVSDGFFARSGSPRCWAVTSTRARTFRVRHQL